MKPIGAAVAAAVLLWWTAAGKAAEPVPAPAPLPPESAVPASLAAPACGCAACAPCAGCGGGRLRAWLFYRPLNRMRFGECHSCCEGRWVPLYLYFLGNCKEHPCTACGNVGCQRCGSCGAFGRPLFGSPTGWGLFGD